MPRPPENLKRYWVSFLVLFTGVICTLMVVAQIRRAGEIKERTRFDQAVTEMTVTIENELEKYTTLLWATASLLTSAKGVDADEFRFFIERMQLAEKYPGIQGIGLSQRLLRERIPEFEAQMREYGYPDFKIWPVDDREEYHAILLLEPQDARNRAALGYDMFSEPVRRQAMELARDTAAPAASGPVTLVQEIDENKQPGFLIYVPLYENGSMPATVEERRELLLGHAYAPFRAGDMFQGLFPEASLLPLHYEVYDGASPDTGVALHRSAPETTHSSGEFEALRQIDLAGRTWTMRYTPGPAFEYAVDAYYARYVLAAGLILSLLLFQLTWGQVRARAAAERHAEDILRSETALAESRRRLDLVMGAVELGVWYCDLPFSTLDWNATCKSHFGLPPDAEVTIDTFYACIVPEDRSRVQHTIEAAIQERRVYDTTYRTLGPDGELRHIQALGSCFYRGDGTPRSFDGITVDVTAQKLSEEKLKQFNELLEQRVAARTAEAEERAAQVREMAVELSQAEHRERRRLATLLHDELQQLLAAAKFRLANPGDGGEEDTRETLRHTDEVLAQAIQVTRSLAIELSPPLLPDRGLGAAFEWVVRRVDQEYGLKVRFEDRAGPVQVANESLAAFVLRAVRELLFNVVKHSGRREAQLLIEKQDGMLQVTIADEGLGFDAGRLWASLGAAEHFGLLNIQQRVELLGGSFALESAPGQGTRVKLRMPLSAMEAKDTSPVLDLPVTAPEAPAQRLSDGNGRLRVLLVDDHKIVREGLLRLLRNEEDLLVVGEAPNGVVAVDLAQQVHPDVIVMDINMPVMNGIEATRSIKAANPGTRIIGLSMHEKEDMAHAMIDAGATAYLSKDGPSASLLAAIRGQRVG